MTSEKSVFRVLGMYDFASNDDLPRSSVSYDAGADVSISYTILQSSRTQWVEINISNEVEVFLLFTFFIPIYPSKIFFFNIITNWTSLMI